MADDPVQNQSASTPSSPADLSAEASAKVESPDTSVPDVTPTVTVLPDIPTSSADLSAEASAKVDSGLTPTPEVSPSASIQNSGLAPVASSPANSVVPNQTDVVSTPITPESPTPTSNSPAPETSTGDSNNIASPQNQTPQVQSAPPMSIPSDINNNETNTSSQSAEIKRETIQPVQSAPSADSTSSKTSFGDILRGNSPQITPPSLPQQPPAIPPLPSDLSAEASGKAEALAKEEKPKSFGDLLKDSPTPPIEPSINIEPIAPPIVPSPVSPPPSSISPISSLSSDVSSRRQKAVQVRRQKHDDNISKILDLLQKKGRVNNNDVRDFLRVSQSTTTDYLHTLVISGKIKKEGKGKATFYSLT